jgi:hypothetical protein
VVSRNGHCKAMRLPRGGYLEVRYGAAGQLRRELLRAAKNQYYSVRACRDRVINSTWNTELGTETPNS